MRKVILNGIASCIIVGALLVAVVLIVAFTAACPTITVSMLIGYSGYKAISWAVHQLES